MLSDNNVSSNGNNASSEDEIRSHLAYLSYYYSLENHNPRLPPPLLSREYWRVAQRVQAGGGSALGGVEGWRRNNLKDQGDGSSLFTTMQPGLSLQRTKDEMIMLRKAAARNLSRGSSTELVDRGSPNLTGELSSGMGVRRKSFTDIVQEGLVRSAFSSNHLAHPAPIESTETTHTGKVLPGFSGVKKVQSPKPCSPKSFSPVINPSLRRSRTPEPHPVTRSVSPGLPTRSRTNSSNILQPQLNSSFFANQKNSKALQQADKFKGVDFTGYVPGSSLNGVRGSGWHLRSERKEGKSSIRSPAMEPWGIQFVCNIREGCCLTLRSLCIKNICGGVCILCASINPLLEFLLSSSSFFEANESSPPLPAEAEVVARFDSEFSTCCCSSMAYIPSDMIRESPFSLYITNPFITEVLSV
ncbi:hypothetical protein RND71_040311 [Anisodus tanguticus]|uniref:Uncharacterized protein n=1 Tax=Anisodus tanguticus TaxID=243964 RepID=A0AAE1QRX7_9SOLA|nr:hypothetical protein RND71_040311 [Anisodus tanguticus]